MPDRSRDEFVRQLWIDGFEFSEDLPTAHLFVRLSDGARVLVPKREILGEPKIVTSAAAEPAAYVSPCCGAESTLRRIYGGTIFFRCTSCTHVWERPAGKRHVLRVVK